jgi:transcriptional regulator with XRE-family HTH domain
VVTKEAIGPGLRKIQMAKTLYRLRVAAGVSLDQAAEALGCAKSRVGHLESARTVPHKPDLIVLSDLYGVPDQLDALLGLWDAAKAKGWWDDYRLPRWLQIYVGLESDAVRLRCWALELVPGLAQTEGYARDVLVAQQSPPSGVERGVQLRMERQRNLERGQVLSMVFSEALIHRTVHMGEAGCEQLTHLIRMSNRYNVQLRIVPFSAGTHRCMAGSFTLMEFPPDMGLGMVAHRQGALHGDFADDPDEVGKLVTTFDGNLAVALDQDASVALIKDVMEAAGQRVPADR